MTKPTPFELRDALTAHARAQGHPLERVAETHISVLGFAPDRVYKARKAVAFGFIDLREQAARLADCEREVALNRRLAPDVYLGVEPLTPLLAHEPAVVMKRLAEDRRLSALVHADRAAAATAVDAVARRLAEFHRDAARGPRIDAAATADAMARMWRNETDQLAAFAGRFLDPGGLERVRTLAERYVAGRHPLFAARIAAGAVCDGHGDLLADDIFCLEDGPRILDCLQFSDTLRAGDVVADVAFLAMDLEAKGAPELAARLWQAYAAASVSTWPVSLAHHHVAYRAHVRAKVACLRAEQQGAAHAVDAVGLLDLALRHCEAARVRLVLVGGLPGTGKSTVARGIADAMDATVVRSDEVRKARAGLRPAQRATAAPGAGIYGPAITDDTYAAMVDAARELIGLGRTVVLDATFAAQRHRYLARAAALVGHADLVELCTVAPRPVALERIARRAAQGTDPSDATAEVHDAIAAAFERWDAVPVHTDGPPADVVARAVAAVRA